MSNSKTNTVENEDVGFERPLELFVRLFRPTKKLKTPEPRKNARLFKIGGGWGNAVEWMTWDTRVNGWKTPTPVDGDILTCEMKSGKTAVWIFDKVEPCGDPADMFFATVAPVGYTDEIKFALPSEQNGDPFGGYRAKESLEAAMNIRNRRF